MRRIKCPFASASLLLIALSIPVPLVSGGFASPAFGSCPDTRFAHEVPVRAGGAVEGIAVADFNGDGLLDLAVTNLSDGVVAPGNIAILLGDGHGSFGTPTQYAAGLGATRIVASDFNADGSTDVAVLNTGDGSVSVLLGDGLGGLGQQTVFAAAGATVGFALGDFNADGRSDLVVTDFFAARIMVLLGSGDGSFSAPTPYSVGFQPLLADVGDLDADGNLDIAVTTIVDATVSLLFGNGDGTFGPHTIVAMPGGVDLRSLAVSDLNGDEILDMAVVDAADDTVLVFLGHGGGSFGLPVAFAVGDQPVFVVVGEFNNDGNPDLAVGNTNDASVSVLLGRGDGTFGPQASLPVGSDPIPMAVGDFNRDGALDLVAGSFTDETVSVLMNECAGNRPPMASAGPQQVLECTGDFQATARLDGSGSTDPDSTLGTNDDISGFEWSERGVFLSSEETASIPLLVGTHAVSLTVKDRSGETDIDTASIDVRDSTPPLITSITADPDTLRPPNQRLAAISITVVASDSCDAAPTCEIISVTSNESIPDSGDDVTDPGWILSDPGPKESPARLAVLLRATRAGAGRAYTIVVSCSDVAGNVSPGVTTVTIAHGGGKGGRESRSGVPRKARHGANYQDAHTAK